MSHQTDPRSPSVAPLTIGDELKPYGHVAAIGMLGGERFYWFVTDDSKPGTCGTRWGTQSVSMIPASVVKEIANG